MSDSNKKPTADQRLKNLTNALYINDNDDVMLRTHVEGITLNTGDVIVDKVKLWDGTNNISFEPVNNDGEAGQNAMPSESYNMVFNGTTWDRMRGNTTTGVLVQVSNFPTTQTVTVSSGQIVVSNFTSTVQVSNNVTATITSMPPFTGTATVYQGTTPWIVKQQNTATDVVIADSNYELNLARGLVDGQYIEMKNGYAPSLSPGVGANEPTVWGLNTPYPWSAWDGAGSRLYVASSNAGDVGQTVVIEGLNINFAKISETVTLNGTTAVVTTATFFRINRMYQYTGATHAGNISARVTSSSGTEVGYMLAGNGRGHGGFFTIPAGYTAYILYGDCSSYKNGSGNVSGQVDMYTRTNVNGTTMPFMNQFVAVVANGQYRNEFNVPLRVPEKTDIDVRFDASGNATTVTVNWEMILIPN